MKSCLIAPVLGLAMLSGTPALAQQACGDLGDPCQTGGGDYYVALPDESAGAPVFVFLHGYGPDREGRRARDNFVEQIVSQGYALILPIGQEHPLIPKMDNWGIEERIDWERDDVAFIDAVLADAIERFDLNGERILFTGFSRGASMVWKYACERPEAANAFVSLSGVFWEPMPESCAGPIHLVHYHGFTDTTIPLEGHVRFEQGERFAQIDVMRGIGFWRGVNGCEQRANRATARGNVWTKIWSPESCEGGSLIFQLGAGKHAAPGGWIKAFIDWFETEIP